MEYEQRLLEVIKHVGLVQSEHHHHFIACNLFSPWYGWKIAYLVLSNNHWLIQVHISSWVRPFSKVGTRYFYPPEMVFGISWFKEYCIRHSWKFFKFEVPPVNSEVPVHLKNIKSPVWVGMKLRALRGNSHWSHK